MIDANILDIDLNDQVSYSDFFKAFGYTRKDEVCFRPIPEPKGREGYPENLSVNFDYVKSIMDTLRSRNEHGCGIFFVVNGAHAKNDVKIARAQFMEIDPDSEEMQMVEKGDISLEDILRKQLEKISSFPLEPSIMIRTRKSIHCYWLIDNGNVKKFSEIQSRLAQYFGGDKSLDDASQIMRLYGFNHLKVEPVMVKLIKFDPELRYTQEQLHEVLPLLKVESKRQIPSDMAECDLSTIERDWAVEWLKEVFFKQNDIEVKAETSGASGSVILGVECPWSHLHTDDTGRKQTAVIVQISGIIGFKCMHHHCLEKGWKQYKACFRSPKKQSHVSQNKVREGGDGNGRYRKSIRLDDVSSL